LVVDDQEAARYLIRKALAGSDYQVLEAASGQEALRLARSEQPQGICLDLHMPEMSGWEVLQVLRSDAQLQQIPVLVITGQVFTEAERQQLAAQDVPVLAKTDLSATTLQPLIARLNAARAKHLRNHEEPGASPVR
jgi:CheY-like chemotaxis protein